MNLIFILIGIAAIGGTIYLKIVEDIDLFEMIFSALFFGFIAIIPAAILGTLLSSIIFGTAPLECEYTRRLIAMKDTSSIYGVSFIGISHIESVPCYVYLAESDRGIKQYQIFDIEDVYIRYTDESPRMEYWSSVKDGWHVKDESPYYVFYLPKGSIVNTYEIDLE